jgi:hypothetical protein
MLLLPLMGMLIGCSTQVQTKIQKVYPDELWVKDTGHGITKSMLNNYGNVRNKALPRCMEAVRLCNADKATIRKWIKE